MCEEKKKSKKISTWYPPRLLKYVPGLHVQPSGPVFAHAEFCLPQDGRQWSELVSAAPWSARWGFGAAALKDRLVIMGGSALWTSCDAFKIQAAAFTEQSFDKCDGDGGTCFQEPGNSPVPHADWRIIRRKSQLLSRLTNRENWWKLDVNLYSMFD